MRAWPAWGVCVCVGGGLKGGSVSGRAARVRTRPPHRLGAPRNDSVSCADNHETETPREYAINWMIYWFICDLCGKSKAYVELKQISLHFT